GFVRRRIGSAGCCDNLKQPVAAGGQRHAPALHRVPRDGYRIGDAAPDDDKRVRFQRLGAEACLDRALDLGRAAPGATPSGAVCGRFSIKAEAPPKPCPATPASPCAEPAAASPCAAPTV